MNPLKILNRLGKQTTEHHLKKLAVSGVLLLGIHHTVTSNTFLLKAWHHETLSHLYAPLQPIGLTLVTCSVLLLLIPHSPASEPHAQQLEKQLDKFRQIFADSNTCWQEAEPAEIRKDERGFLLFFEGKGIRLGEAEQAILRLEGAVLLANLIFGDDQEQKNGTP